MLPAISSQNIEEASNVAEKNTTDDLSAREVEVLVHIVKGLSNKEIADTMCLSTHTVMSHRKNIVRKLNIHSIAGLTIYAIVNGIIDLNDEKLI